MTEASRGIDHVVLSVRDMDAAQDFFWRAGFTLTPKAELPAGTSNQLALLNGNFIDLLGTTTPERIPPHRPGRYSSSAQHQDLLARREGLSFVVLSSNDTRLDHERFVAGGLPASEPLDIFRPAGQPNGEQATVSLSIVVIADPKFADAQHFVYQVHTPQYFWHAAYQDHANGALEISEVVLVADEPAVLAPFYSVLVAPNAVHGVGNHLHIATAKGRIIVLPPTDLARRFDGRHRRLLASALYRRISGLEPRSGCGGNLSPSRRHTPRSSRGGHTACAGAGVWRRDRVRGGIAGPAGGWGVAH